MGFSRQEYWSEVPLPSPISPVQLFCDPMTVAHQAPVQGFSVHGIFQARVLERVAISSSRGPSQPRNRTQASYVSCIGGQILSHCATLEALSDLLIPVDFASGLAFCLEDQVHSTSFFVFFLLLDSLSIYSCKI